MGMDHNAFAVRLRRFSRSRRGLINTAMAMRLGVYACIAGMLALVLLGGLLPGMLLNLSLFALLLIALCSLLVVGLIRRRRYHSLLDEAFHLEKLAGNLRSRVISTEDFLRAMPRTALMEAVIVQAEKDLRENYEGKLDRRPRNRWLTRCAAALALFLMLGCIPLFGFGRVWNNFLNHWQALRDYLNPLEYQIAVEPDQPAYRVGKDTVAVTLSLNRSYGGEVTLVRQMGDVEERESLPLVEGRTARVVVRRDQEVEEQLSFEFAEQRSDPIKLIFTSPPTLLNMQTELVYPTYTRLPPRSLDQMQERILALPRSRITLGFTFSKELKSADLTLVNKENAADVTTLPLDVAGRYATVGLVQGETSRQATLLVRDIHGFPLDEPYVFDLDVQNDEKPLALLPGHLKENMYLLEPAAKLFGFGAQVQDDYGVAKVVLHWEKTSTLEPEKKPVKGTIERPITPAQPRTVATFEKAFADLDLKSGDRVSFRLEVFDNREGKPQSNFSRRCSLLVHQEDLGDLAVRELGFGSGDLLGRERIARSTRAATVKEPEGLKSKEQMRLEYEANVQSGTQAPTVRGPHADAVRDYFRLLSNVKGQ